MKEIDRTKKRKKISNKQIIIFMCGIAVGYALRQPRIVEFHIYK